jgi:Iap family predicted aminopeptidase
MFASAVSPFAMNSQITAIAVFNETKRIPNFSGYSTAHGSRPFLKRPQAKCDHSERKAT